MFAKMLLSLSGLFVLFSRHDLIEKNKVKSLLMSADIISGVRLHNVALTHHKQSQDQSHSRRRSATGPASHGCSPAWGLFSPASHTQTLPVEHLKTPKKNTPKRGQNRSITQLQSHKTSRMQGVFSLSRLQPDFSYLQQKLH